MPRVARYKTASNGRPIWMPVYVADRVADTAHLSVAEFGCLHRLELAYWRSGPPRNDDEVLSRICGCSLVEFRRHKESLLAFFEVFGEQLISPHLDDEMKKACALVAAKRKQTAKASAARAERNGVRNVPRDDGRNEVRSSNVTRYVTSTQSQVNGNTPLAKPMWGVSPAEIDEVSGDVSTCEEQWKGGRE